VKFEFNSVVFYTIFSCIWQPPVGHEHLKGVQSLLLTCGQQEASTGSSLPAVEGRTHGREEFGSVGAQRDRGEGGLWVGVMEG
jgi:hypothetical protein